jgi:hypothetical protein
MNEQIDRNRRTLLGIAAGAAANRRELDCLSLGYAYEIATNWTNVRVPSLLSKNVALY